MIVPLTSRSVDHDHCLHLATTVRKHLGHVYAKLRVTSRVQLAHQLPKD